MLVADGADRLEVVAVLNLTGLLLHKFVRDLEAREFVADACREAVIEREVALVLDGEVCRGALVGKVLRYDWVKVMAGAATGGACQYRVFAPGVLQLSKGLESVVAATA